MTRLKLVPGHYGNSKDDGGPNNGVGVDTDDNDCDGYDGNTDGDDNHNDGDGNDANGGSNDEG